MKTSLAYKFSKFMREQGRRLNPLENEAVIHMRSEIDQLDEGIQFTVSTYEDGSWMAKSTNVEGILSGGRDASEIPEVIKDAIFTYYDIPPKYCNDDLLRGTGEKKVVKREAFVTT